MTKRKTKPKHARLSPSASSRWIACPPSIDAAARLPRGESSSAAAEGTLAHAVLEAALMLGLDPLEISRYEGQDVPEQMQHAVGHAVNYVHRWKAEHPKGEVFLEHELNPGALLEREDMYGTSDIVLVDDSSPKTLSLEIVDYKHGRFAVNANDNTQLMLYAAGALHAFFTEPKKVPVKLVIIQPRVEDFPAEWDTDGRHILSWITTTARQAAEASDDPNAPRKAGEHCKWCRASGHCRELTMQVFRVAALEFNTEEPISQDTPATNELDIEEIAYALTYRGMIEAFLSGLLVAAQDLMLDGHDLPGHKLVYKRNRSSYADKDKVVAWAERVGLPLERFAPRNPLSFSQMKKAFDIKKFGLTEAQRKSLVRLVVPPKPEITVAPVSDSRKPLPRKSYGYFKARRNEHE